MFGPCANRHLKSVFNEHPDFPILAQMLGGLEPPSTKLEHARMLFALLYDSQDKIVAAAMACDQQPVGDRYWDEYHLVKLAPKASYQTAYVTVTDPFLQSQLLKLGIDETVDEQSITNAVESLSRQTPFADRAA